MLSSYYIVEKHSPGDSSVVETNFSLKLDPESCLQMVFVLARHDGPVAALKDVVPTNWDLKHAREVFLDRGEGEREKWGRDYRHCGSYTYM